LIGSADGRDDSVTVNQDVSVYGAVVEQGQMVSHQLAANRHAWIQVARGDVVINGENLDQGDGAAISGESSLTVSGRTRAEILLFDMA
jgi:quercetin 2,3-dioxygenase